MSSLPFGVHGPQGAQGPQGFQGAQGAAGAQGRQGRTGPAGPPGVTGATGRQGFQGYQGNPGAQGYQGPQGSSGVQGPSASYSYVPNALGVGISPFESGTLLATSSITAGYSDIRLKDNIHSITDAGEKLYSLHGVFYQHNEIARQYHLDNNRSQVGLLAQEVQKVLPEVVKAAPFDIGPDDTSRSGENYLTVQYEKIIPLIIETVKEQQTLIDHYRKVLGIHGK